MSEERSTGGPSPLDQRLLDAMERLAQGRRAFLQDIATQRELSPLQIDVLSTLDGDSDLAPELALAGGLARRLDVAASTIADATATLRRKGLLTDRPDPADRRRRRLVLTDAGRATAAAIAAERQVAQQALTGLDPEAKAAALDVVLTLIANLHERGVITLDRSCKTCRFRIPAIAVAVAAEPAVAAVADGGPDGARAGTEVTAPVGDHCSLLDQPLRPVDLRVVCPEHQPRPAA